MCAPALIISCFNFSGESDSPSYTMPPFAFGVFPLIKMGPFIIISTFLPSSAVEIAAIVPEKLLPMTSISVCFDIFIK